MAEYIKRDILRDSVASFMPPSIDDRNQAYVDGLTDALILICRAPAADVVERKTGKWLEVELLHLSDDPEELEATSVASMRCSVCKRYHNEAHLYGSDLTEDVNYCPYCGAKMGGNENV